MRCTRRRPFWTLTVQNQASVLSYIDGFWLTGVVLFALVPLVFVMRRAKGGGVPLAH